MSTEYAHCIHCGAAFLDGDFIERHAQWCPYWDIDGGQYEVAEWKPVQLPAGYKVLEFRSKAVPMGKPRMTNRDKFAKRPSVQRYWAFKDQIRADARYAGYVEGLMDVHEINVQAWLPMPTSWSKKKRNQLDGDIHRGKPDADNILKGVGDALLEDDSGVYSMSIQKYWSWDPGLVVEIKYVERE